MADIRTIAKDIRRTLGVGRPISQEKAGRLSPVVIDFPSFERGIDLRDVEQDQDGISTQEALNFEVESDGSLKRTAGHSVAETMSDGRMVKAMLLHTSLDFTSELLLFDSPYMGIKSSGATTWYDMSLPDGDEWAGISNLDKVLLVNGSTGIYRRDFAATTASLITNSPSAYDIANFAGRVFVLGVAYPAGTYQALGIGWSGDAEGLSWTGLGSGAQLLIADTSTDDRGIALRAMNFDLLAVLCQRSIWIGRPTGDLYEPAIFEPRVQGIGCISRRTACLTPAGVMFLSESGVYLFDGNSAQLLSRQINGELLPILTNVANTYSAVYDQVESRYLLFTPTCTWVYDVKYDRWLKWGYVVNGAVAFSEQFSGVTWENVLATWASVSDAWVDFGSSQGVQRLVYAKDDKLGVDSVDSMEFLDSSDATAQYGFLRRDTTEVNSMFETQRLRLRYAGDEAELELWLPNQYGELMLAATKTLPARSVQDGAELGVRYTGRGAGAQIRWSEPSLRVSRAQLQGLPRGHRQGVL